jgi:metal-responsive CopG/Arc/MetJ family transcriptional regulator
MIQHHKATGISLPDELLKEIDSKRGDISRSRYMLRLLEKPYKCDECRKKDSLDSGFASLQSSESDST